MKFMRLQYAENRLKTRISAQSECRHFMTKYGVSMQNSKSVSDLMAASTQRLAALAAQLKQRGATVELVRGALPAPLARHIASAGIDKGCLSIGVTGAAWATRLRYQTDNLRRRLGAALHMNIASVRIRVVLPRSGSSLTPGVPPPHRK
jgi:hypothetical protein